MATLALDSLLDGRYRLGPVLGRGSSAEVREAHDERGGGVVAIKFVAMDRPDARARAASEIGALERLDHPNLLAARAHGEVDGYVYVVTDLVRGQTLEARIHHERLTPTEVATIGSAVAAGLTHAHHLGVVHRDLKPANVLLGDDGTVRLADFGIARLVGQAGHTSSGLINGSAPYLAPEQVDGGFISPATDVYALGLVVLEALTGRQAFEGTPIESAQARLRQSPAIPSELSEDWRSLVTEMTARQPGDRPTSAEVTERLDRLADGSSSMPVVITPDSAPTSLIAAADLDTISADASDGGTAIFPAAAVAAAGATRLGTVGTDATEASPAAPAPEPAPEPEAAAPPIPPPAAAATGTAAFGAAWSNIGEHWDRIRYHRQFPIAVAVLAIALLMGVAVARADGGDPVVAADEPIETTTSSTPPSTTTTSTTIAPAFPPGPAPDAPDAPDDDGPGGKHDKRDKHDDD